MTSHFYAIPAHPVADTIAGQLGHHVVTDVNGYPYISTTPEGHRAFLDAYATARERWEGLHRPHSRRRPTT